VVLNNGEPQRPVSTVRAATLIGAGRSRSPRSNPHAPTIPHPRETSGSKRGAAQRQWERAKRSIAAQNALPPAAHAPADTHDSDARPPPIGGGKNPGGGTLRALRLALPLFGWFAPTGTSPVNGLARGIMGSGHRAACVQRCPYGRVGGWWGGVAVGFPDRPVDSVRRKVRGQLSSFGGGPVLDRDVFVRCP